MFFVYKICSIICLLYYVSLPTNSLAQELALNVAAQAQLELLNFNREPSYELLAAIEGEKINNTRMLAKNDAKKVVSTKKSSVKKATAIKKKKAVKRKGSKNRMTIGQIREERAKKTHMLNGYVSWYGDYFHGRKTASGAIYDQYMYTSAHRTLPLGTIVEIIEEEKNNRAVVCINDRGPYIKGRAIDVSRKVAEQLNLLKKGIAPVAIKIVGDKNGKVLSKDKAFYVSLNGTMSKESFVGPFTQFADASVMWEALHHVHDKSSIVIDLISVE